jgi:hypothetical protein
MDLRPTNSRDDIAHARQADEDWAALTTADRVRYLELEGYVVIPDLLDAPRLSPPGSEVAVAKAL